LIESAHFSKFSVVAVAASSIERAHPFLEKHRLAFETIAYGSYQQLIDDPNVGKYCNVNFSQF
jgi:predicted dehydrogenase